MAKALQARTGGFEKKLSDSRTQAGEREKALGGSLVTSPAEWMQWRPSTGTPTTAGVEPSMIMPTCTNRWQAPQHNIAYR